MMDVLWAGWRSAYMAEVQAGIDPDACLFCELPAAADEDAYIIDEPLVVPGSAHVQGGFLLPGYFEFAVVAAVFDHPC